MANEMPLLRRNHVFKLAKARRAELDLVVIFLFEQSLPFFANRGKGGPARGFFVGDWLQDLETKLSWQRCPPSRVARGHCMVGVRNSVVVLSFEMCLDVAYTCQIRSQNKAEEFTVTSVMNY